MKVFPSEAQAKAQEILAKCKSISKEDINLIARVRAADDKDKFSVQNSFDITQALDTTDGEGENKKIESSEDADANAMAAAEQLLAEQDAELSKNQSERKAKSKKRKAKNSSNKLVSQAEPTEKPKPTEQGNSPEKAKSSEKAKSTEKGEESVQSKSETFGPDAGQKSSEGVTVEKPEALASDDAASPPKSTTAPNDEKKDQAKTNVTEKSGTPSKPVITLADYEDAPAGTQSPTNENEGWQTVKKPSKAKPSAVTAVRTSSGGIPGAYYGSQRGVNQSSGPVQQVSSKTDLSLLYFADFLFLDQSPTKRYEWTGSASKPN